MICRLRPDHQPSSGSHRRRRASAPTGFALLATGGLLALTSCTATPGPPASHPAASTPTRAAPQTAAMPNATVSLRASSAPWRLPAPISREVVLNTGSELKLVGGLTASGTSNATVLSLDPATGMTRTWGRLKLASHDAAGAILGGRAYLFGGGASGSIAAVQRLRPHTVATAAASLPTRRSDLAAATIGAAAYLVGGYDGTSLSPSVLKSTDGIRFTTIASLPVPVRYPALAVHDGTIWVFGGQTATGLTDVIQRVDVSTGRSSVAGHLPSRLSAATAVPLHGQIYLCGGTTPAGPIDAIRRFDTLTAATHLVGHLPTPLSNSASAVLGGTGYLLGGEAPATTAAVVLLEVAPGPNPTRSP